MSTSYTYNGYFIFPIPELTDQITDIQLVLELVSYCSEDLTEDILLSGVSTAPEELKLTHTLNDIGMAPWIYYDLMDGPELGILTVDLGTLAPFRHLSRFENDGKGPLFSCCLNETAIRAITESAGEQFVIGFSLIDISSTEEEYVVFDKNQGDTDYWVHYLQITTIPEPATLLFLAIGTVCMKRRKK